MQKRPSSGFTLIELMIVVVIIGLLAVITIPSFIGMRYSAKNAQTRRTMVSLWESEKRFGSQHGHFTKSIDSLSVSASEDYDPTLQRFRNAMTRKFTEPSITKAPAAVHLFTDGNEFHIVGFNQSGIPFRDTLWSNK